MSGHYTVAKKTITDVKCDGVTIGRVFTPGNNMQVGINSEFYIGNKKFEGRLKGWQLEASTNDLTTARLDFVITDRIISNKPEQKTRDLYPLIWLGIGIIAFCLIWSI